MKWTILLISLATLVLANKPPPGTIKEVINVDDPKEQAELVRLITATPTDRGNSSLFLEARLKLGFESIFGLDRVVGATRQLIAGFYCANVTVHRVRGRTGIDRMIGLQFGKRVSTVHLYEARFIPIK